MARRAAVARRSRRRRNGRSRSPRARTWRSTGWTSRPEKRTERPPAPWPRTSMTIELRCFAGWVLGQGALLEGRLDEAARLLEAARAPAERLDDRRYLAMVLTTLGAVLAARGDGDGAIELCRESASISDEIGDRYFRSAAAFTEGVERWKRRGARRRRGTRGQLRPTASRLRGPVPARDGTRGARVDRDDRRAGGAGSAPDGRRRPPLHGVRHDRSIRPGTVRTTAARGSAATGWAGRRSSARSRPGVRRTPTTWSRSRSARRPPLPSPMRPAGVSPS